MIGTKILLKSAFILSLVFASSGAREKKTLVQTADSLPSKREVAICCESNIPSRFAIQPVQSQIQPVKKESRAGMVWIADGTFQMGGDNKQAAADEFPKHQVTVDGFWMSTTEVTNQQFAEFVKAIGYISTAECKPDWNELKKQLPPGTP